MMGKVLKAAGGGGKITTENLTEGNIKAGITVTVKQGNKTVKSIDGKSFFRTVCYSGAVTAVVGMKSDEFPPVILFENKPWGSQGTLFGWGSEFDTKRFTFTRDANVDVLFYPGSSCREMSSTIGISPNEFKKNISVKKGDTITMTWRESLGSGGWWNYGGLIVIEHY